MNTKPEGPKNVIDKTNYAFVLRPILVGLLLLMSLLFMAGCDSSPMSNEDFISETANCEANGFASRTIKSSWDSDVIGVQCYTPRQFQPHQTEFVLTDGTRCVMVSTPPATSRRAGSSGISCDWDNNAN